MFKGGGLTDKIPYFLKLCLKSILGHSESFCLKQALRRGLRSCSVYRAYNALMSKVVKSCQKLSKVVKGCRKLSKFVKSCQKLSKVVKCC